jgi:putative NADH-flavin reductase
MHEGLAIVLIRHPFSLAAGQTRRHPVRVDVQIAMICGRLAACGRESQCPVGSRSGPCIIARRLKAAAKAYHVASSAAAAAGAKFQEDTGLMRVGILLTLLAPILLAAQAAAAQTSAQAAHKPPAILLVGASGMIGSRILNEAASRGHDVLAAARHPEKIISGPNIHPLKLDATDTKGFIEAAQRVDVIVLATSPRGGGDPMAQAKAVADAAIATARATHKRLMVVGGAGSLNLPDGRRVVDTLPQNYQPEALAMRGVLDALKASDTNWTFFSPPMSIAPGAHTGKYHLGTTLLLTDEKGASRISAEDYADALVSELEKPAHVRSQMTAAY